MPARNLTRYRSLSLAISAVLLAAPFGSISRAADVVVRLDGGYHAQVTNFFCAAASAEMALDVPAVRNANPVVNGMLSVGDGPTVPANSPLPLATLQIQGGIGIVTGGAQAFIYGLNHGLNTVNGVGYYNPFSPPGSGTDSQGLDVGLNLLDNPAVNGAANPALPFGSHSYAGYNLLNQGLASRTIANALNDFGVPAVAAVNNGSHAISVYGVKTDGAIGKGLNYKIKGFYVHDPWTGWAVQQQNAGKFDPAKVKDNGGLGLGYNTYLRYGFDQDPSTTMTQLPNGNMVSVTLAPWTKIFSPSGGQLTPNLQWTNPGYKFEIEPLGPELPDLGDPANDFGFPEAPANLPSAINSSTMANTYAMSDLASFPELDSLLELPGGHFDIADGSFMQSPDESGAEGDWLIPYDGPGGVNDVTGAIFIDVETGLIDQATWIDPNDPNQVPYTLDQINTLFEDEIAGDLPVDNLLPEPALLPILLASLPLIRRRRTQS